VKLARESGYTSAGTVEFLLDGEGNYYFLEVNTRLQVEHPVTEMRTGLDIVREQIRIAQGEPLSCKQEDVPLRGHAIECRIYAEDPSSGFLPSTGRIVHLRAPGGGNIREERALQEGDVVSAYYDPLISKLIAWGESRGEALAKMARALSEYELFGVRNNLKLCSWVIDHPKFQEGKFSTWFLEAEFTPESLDGDNPAVDEVAALAAVLAHVRQDNTVSNNSSVRQDTIVSNNNGSTKKSPGWLKKREDSLR
jgi:acetyl/propionyl-CoA carboxylase alpha subunit